MIFDQNENGAVSVDETLSFLQARYGRTGLELKLKELFGEDMVETGSEGGEIDFLTYLDAVNREEHVSDLEARFPNQPLKAKRTLQ